MTQKTPGWETRLIALIAAAHGRPFLWGTQDCATWAFDARAALTEQPSAAEAWRGQYQTALGAEKVMRRLGWPDRVAMGCDLLGAPLPSPLFAQRGDLLLGPEHAFGLCAGGVGVFVSPNGAVELPLQACSHAWRS